MLIDAHAHLDQYGDAELVPALGEINQFGIFTVSVSMDLPSWQRNLELARGNPLVLPTFGIHPWNAPEYVHRLEELIQPTQETPMIGEVGLDYNFVEDSSKYPAQRTVLEFFLAAAHEQKKIVNLHTKGAEEDILRLLDCYAIERAIIHWYSGSFDTLRRLVARGCYFTVGVEVLQSEHIREIAQEIPEDRLLTETDNPGGQKWLEGYGGMPRLVLDVVVALAGLRKTTPLPMCETVQRNFLRLLGDDSRLELVRKTVLS